MTPATRRKQSTLTAAIAGLCLLALAWCAGPAQAAVIHQYEPGISQALGEGVPAGCGASEPSPPCIPGPLNLVNSMTVDDGDLFVAEKLETGVSAGRARVDGFDGGSGGFVAGSQLVEEGGVSTLFGAVAVGHAGVGRQVYVAASKAGEGVVAAFEGKSLVGAWSGAATANGSFTQSGGANGGSLTGVAVDGSGGATGGDVYVSTASGRFPAFNVVDVFRPVGIGGGEPSVVGELRGTCAAGTVCTGDVVPFGEPLGVAVSGKNGDVLVSDGGKTVDVFAPAGPGEFEFLFQLTGTPAGLFQRIAIGNGVAVDSGTGNIYVTDEGAGVVDEFSETGVFLGRLSGTGSRAFRSLTGVAVDGESHRVYVGDYNEEKRVGSVDVFGPDVVIPDVVTQALSGLAPREAMLNGTVNPDKEGPAECVFAYGTTEALGKTVECEGTGSKATPVPDGNSAISVKAKLAGLLADTTYYYRLQASNKNGVNPGEAGQDQHFTTPGPGLHDESVSAVAATSATLRAAIDPHGAETSYYFEYGKTSDYEAQAPAAPGAALGSGNGDVAVSRHVQGLVAGTVYHYRVVAVSRVEVAAGAFEAQLFPGPDQTFVTQGVGSALVLPDGRAWELVSPVDKHGALIKPITEAGVAQAAVGGGAVTYVAHNPTEAGVHGYGETVQVLSTRGPGGWSSLDTGPAHSAPTGIASGDGPEFKFSSEDLSRGLFEPYGPFTSQAPEVFPADSERTPYIRNNATCGESPGGCWEPLVTGAPGYADVPEGTAFGGTQQLQGQANFVGATPDLAHVILSSPVALAPTPTNGKTELYEWSAAAPYGERLQLVSALNNGEASTRGAQLGFDNLIARHAVSDDGSRVVWSDAGTGGGHLYERDTVKDKTVQLDAVQGGAGEGGANPVFQLASADGSRVFFTDTQQLTTNSGAQAGKPDLYECAVVEAAGGELECQLSDLTPASAGGESASVQGAVLGASEDGSWVYLLSNGVLGESAAEGATPGACHEDKSPKGVTCNLYALHNNGDGWEKPRFIASLSGDDFPDWTGNGGDDLADLTARVSPNGEWLAFMSDRSLTGYDNEDATSKTRGERPDEEVYLYDAAAGHLACASCDPTGARPDGKEYNELNDGLAGGDRMWGSGQWIAGNIPGWTAFQALSAAYQSRYLSNEGRLFFNSSDALVPQDINNNEDVYEYEPPAGPESAGETPASDSCTTASATFSTTSDGCVSLISSGTAAGESAFLDASETGDDVFFLTGERLTRQDIDTSLDVYDAHVCSGSAPCVTPAEAPPVCTTADACRAAPSPQPGVFGSPSSSTFSGAGNLTPTPATPVVKPKAKPKTRAQKLAGALKACRKDRARAKRARCETAVRRKYARVRDERRKGTRSG